MSEINEVLSEIKKLRSQSIFKDVLLALVPLLVALLSIFYSNKNTERQLSFSENQLQQNKEIENAKLLERFSKSILSGGEDARLAKIALDSVQLTKKQNEQLAKYFEEEFGGSDQPTQPEPVQAADNEELASLLDQIFSQEKHLRELGYTPTREYLRDNYSNKLVGQMIRKIQTNQFNINGRSNILSILTQMSSDQLKLSKSALFAFFQELELKGSEDPALAFGPQTKGWIQEIRKKLA